MKTCCACFLLVGLLCGNLAADDGATSAAPHCNIFFVEPPVSEISLPPHVPIFSKPEPNIHNLLFILQEPCNLKVQKQAVYATSSLFDKKYTPIVREFDFYQVVSPRGERLWASPQLISYVQGNNSISLTWRNEKETWKIRGAIGFLLIGCLLAALGIMRQQPKGLVLSSISLLFVQCASVGFFCYCYGFFYVGWIDGSDYLNTTHQLWQMQTPVSGKPVGWPILLLPFYLWYQTHNVFALGPAIALVNACLLNGLVAVLLFVLTLQITPKKSVGLAAAVIFLLIPWFYTTDRWGFPQSANPFVLDKQYFALSSFQLLNGESFSLRFYRAAEWIGLNVLSDTAALLFLLLGVVLLMSKNNRVLCLLLSGLCLGYSCSIRIGYLAFVPCVLLWKFLSDTPKERMWKTYVYLAIGIALGILPQVVDNIWRSGSPFRTPYHFAAEHIGFSLSLVPRGLRYLASLHYQILCAGALALLCYRPHKIRIFCAALAITCIGFFAGYTHNTTEEVRFVMPGLVILVLYTTWYVIDIGTQVVRRRNLRLAVLLFVGLVHVLFIVPNSLFLLPRHFRLLAGYPFDGQSVLVNGAVFALAVISGLWYGGVRVCFYAALASLFYLSGLWIVAGVGILASGALALAQEIRPFLSVPKPEDAHGGS